MAEDYKEKIQSELDTILDTYTEQKTITVPTAVNDDGSLKYGPSKTVTAFKVDSNGDPLFKGFYTYDEMIGKVMEGIADDYVSINIQTLADITIAPCSNSGTDICITPSNNTLIDNTPFYYGAQKYLSIALNLSAASIPGSSIEIILTDITTSITYSGIHYVAGSAVWALDIDMTSLPNNHIYKVKIIYNNSDLVSISALGIAVMLRVQPIGLYTPIILTS